MSEYHDEHEIDPIEGYCVRCRESVEIDHPQPVWTRRGMPATRGECPICGGTVFRMGKTDLHDPSNRPEAVEIGDTGKRGGPKLARDTVYVNYAPADEEFAQQVAADLEKVGLAVWLHEHQNNEDPVAWASGIHPALKECKRMVFVLSPSALDAPRVGAAWKFFRDQRKPIIIAQIDPATPPPDPIRRSPRYDFSANYKAAFRQMIDTLG